MILSVQQPVTAANSSDVCDSSGIVPSRSLSSQQPLIAVKSSDARDTITTSNFLFRPYVFRRETALVVLQFIQYRDIVRSSVVRQQEANVSPTLLKKKRGLALR